MARKSTLDKEKVIKLYKEGMSYFEIANVLNSKEETIKKCIYRNAKSEVEERKRNHIENIINLYKQNYSYSDIARELGIEKEAVKKCLYKYAKKEIEKRSLEKRNERKIEVRRCSVLTSKDIKEMTEEKTFILKKGETVGVRSFINWNRQSYITVRKGSLKFDKSRGMPTRDTPSTYNYEV